jgi:RimJ/RimL family protein N-acetyltransferase
MRRRLKLRALRLEDAAVTWAWRNQDDIRDQYSGHPFPVNYEMERSWLERIACSNIPTTVFGIEVVSSQKLIGMTVLRDINLISREAEFAMLIGDKEERRKGYGAEALRLTLDFAFQQLGLNRVFLKVNVDNAPALRLYEKCGFQEEGRLRESVFKKGLFKDQLVMSILSREFRCEEDSE